MVCNRAGNVEGGCVLETADTNNMGSTICGAAVSIFDGMAMLDMTRSIAAPSAARGLALRPGAAR